MVFPHQCYVKVTLVSTRSAVAAGLMLLVPAVYTDHIALLSKKGNRSCYSSTWSYTLQTSDGFIRLVQRQRKNFIYYLQPAFPLSRVRYQNHDEHKTE